MNKIYKDTSVTLCAIALITASSLTNASSIPYGVFAGMIKALISRITGSDVTELAKVEGWDLSDAGSSLSSDGLTIAGSTQLMALAKMNTPRGVGTTLVQTLLSG